MPTFRNIFLEFALFSAKRERNPQKFALQCKNSLEKCDFG
nr:MAG TPA: hypothetical protein [Caudoviricetes sp.]